MSVGVSLDAYQAYKFYTLFDYTGHQNLFIVPTLSVDVGEKVSSRFVQLVTRYTVSPAAGDLRVFAYHYCKILLQWQPNLALDIIN